MIAVIADILLVLAYLTAVGFFIWPGPRISDRRQKLGGSLSARRAASKLTAEIDDILSRVSRG